MSKQTLLLSTALVKCPHCEKTVLAQQTGKDKFWCSKCNKPFIVKE
nr:hypothetical protein DMOBY_06020 [Dehalococcoides mccartyi]